LNRLRRRLPVIFLENQPETGVDYAVKDGFEAGTPMSNEVISEDYRQQQVELHKNPDYGRASLSFAPRIVEIMRLCSFRSISDYGAGKQNLLKGLKKAGLVDLEYYPYDPAFPEYGLPRTADLVCCIDVLEHIEPELLDNVLSDLERLVIKLGFFSIDSGPAKKTLADGRNAHLIQQPTSWWLKKLSDRFEVRHLETVATSQGFYVVVEPKEPENPDIP